MPAARTRAPVALGSGKSRGQTSIDFLIGIGVFLTTVGFVALFAMDVVTPFAGEQGGALVADRTADELVGVTFAGPAGTNVLNESCTSAFFDVGSDDGCPFQSTNPLTERVGIDDRWDLNVTLERNDPAAGYEVLCLDNSGDLQSCSAGGTRLAAGDPADFGSDGIFTAVRVATFNDRDIAVVVRLW